MTRLAATPAILGVLVGGMVVAGLAAGCGNNRAAISQQSPDAGAGGAAGAGSDASMGGSGVPAAGGVHGGGGVAATGGSPPTGGSAGTGGTTGSGGAMLGGTPALSGGVLAGGGARAGGAGAGARAGGAGAGASAGGVSGGGAGGAVDGGGAGDVRDAPGGDEGGGVDAPVGGEGDAAGDSSGAEGDTAVRPAPGQRILFEVASSNFAMAVVSEGIYITSDGGVYKWVTGNARPVPTDGGSLPLLGRAEQMTEAQVTAKYGASPELTATVPAAELLDMYALVGDARKGELLTQYSCNDAGEDQFVAWLYDSSTSTYTPVLLGVDGDTAIRNLSPAADKLVTWLVSLWAPQALRDCRWRESEYSCTGATCTAAPPVCSGTQIPVVVGGCWGSCVTPNYCPEVSSCSDCGTGLACITDTDGKHHCSALACSNPACAAPYDCSTDRTKEVTCDCAADQICAGGRAWCRGSLAQGFSCVAP